MGVWDSRRVEFMSLFSRRRRLSLRLASTAKISEATKHNNVSPAIFQQLQFLAPFRDTLEPPRAPCYPGLRHHAPRRRRQCPPDPGQDLANFSTDFAPIFVYFRVDSNQKLPRFRFDLKLICDPAIRPDSDQKWVKRMPKSGRKQSTAVH